MVNTEMRRVKSLRLSAPTDSSLRRGQILAEDALRTASLPGAIGGRVLIVRSLKLGIIRSRQSSASLALAIEQSLYTLGSQAVYAEDLSANSSHVVYFKDEVEPYVCLALRLARGRSVAGWFWPLAVPFWRPEMARDEALRSLLGATLRTQAGVAAAVALVRELFECEAIEPLLGALRWQDGPALLKACGWSQHAGLPLSLLETTASESVRQTLSLWDSPLAIWIKRWGADDARSSWLAATALAANRPARLQDQRLMSQARQVIKLVTQSAQPSRIAEQNKLAEKGGTLRAETPSLPSANEPLRLNAAPTAKPSASPPLVTGAGEGDARPDLEESRALEDESYALEEERRVLDEVSSGDFDEEASLLNSFSIASTGEARQPASSIFSQTTSPVFSEDRQSEVKPSPRPHEFPRPTAYAGLFLLVPVLSRLGFSSLLDANPRLIEHHLPERFLSLAGERLGIPVDDPAISFLSAAAQGAEPVPSQCEFIAPSVWLEGLCRRGPLVVCRMPDEPMRRTLCDSSKKLALALWRGRAPQSVRALIGDAKLKRALSPRVDDLQVLLESWLVAARRWCRRFARIGLSELVCRAGRVSQTRTHIDVLFNPRQADVRVRKAGLDLNQGWVAWLGRVVTFYYLYGEQGNGY
ncbi:MAG: hypothetical protein QOJ02_4238 [Acidobacteriota bacterium]|jgi:hypothetical protein|nr:hypothetical protein [Acidobacteriota bacterium]